MGNLEYTSSSKIVAADLFREEEEDHVRNLQKLVATPGRGALAANRGESDSPDLTKHRSRRRERRRESGKTNQWNPEFLIQHSDLSAGEGSRVRSSTARGVRVRDGANPG
jgi:hypothetical protein